MGAHETAIAFLTDLEEKLEVAQVQLEIFHTLLPRATGEDVAKVQLLSKRLFNITEVCSEQFAPGNLTFIFRAALSIICGALRPTGYEAAHLPRFRSPR